MAAAATTKTKRKSTTATKPATKRARKAAVADESASDVQPSGDDSAGASPSNTDASSDEDVKPKAKKPKGKAATKKDGKAKGGKANGKPTTKKATKAKGRKSKGADSSDGSEYAAGDGSEEDEDDHDFESDATEGGVRVRVIRDVMEKKPAPKENAETPVILPTTMNFLARLAKNNEREWFKARDAEYRHALLNFNTFVKAWIPLATEADWQLPHLPAKDVTHWIYRDVRFSKDKTPYKTYFCANHSRTGRKGPFAGYYLHLSPGNKSFLGCGIWSPETNGLKAIRDEILRDPTPLRSVLAEPKFVEMYGADKPRMDGKRTGIFGCSDQLKNAPKLPGVDKTHKDIDLLKCRSFCVETHFTDEQVLSDEFLQTVKNAMEVAVPFVHQINEMIMPTPVTDDEGGGGDDDGADEAASEENGSAEEEDGEA
ncbi:hypothetical protein JCM8202_004700 [Rhodotorula sphaerocarpa]